MNNIKAVFMKQMLDTVKNKTIFVQFLMFPVLAVIMENTVKIEGMPEHFFAKLFSVMFIGMAPLSCMAAVLSEEKEKNTLRALMMSSVKPQQYLIAVGVYIFMMCMVGTSVFAVLCGFRGAELARFVTALASGIVLSELAGAAIGMFSKSQMAATSLTLPVMMVFSFSPMLSMFNENIRKIAGITYLQQISNMINGIGTDGVSAKSIVVIAANFMVGLVLFCAAYMKKGLD